MIAPTCLLKLEYIANFMTEVDFTAVFEMLIF